jgi:leucyl aminopeptidase (aminopeptidase T)
MLVHLLAITAGERLVILTDANSGSSLATQIGDLAEQLGASVAIKSVNGAQPEAVAGALESRPDVLISFLPKPLTHLPEVRAALQAGTRFCNLRDLTVDVFINGGGSVDYAALRATTQHYAELLTQANTLRVTTAAGTDLVLDIRGRTAKGLDGFARKSGEIGGIPNGEVYVAPVEGRGSGVVVDPYMIEGIGVRHHPFRMELTSGNVGAITGGEEAEQLLARINQAGPGVRNLAEFALGTNPRCRLTGDREVKKRLGTAHIAIGDNVTLGGQIASNLHLDFILLKPTVELDGEVIMDQGRPILAEIR